MELKAEHRQNDLSLEKIKKKEKKKVTNSSRVGGRKMRIQVQNKRVDKIYLSVKAPIQQNKAINYRCVICASASFF